MTTPRDTEHDLVVVGAGPAGATLAALVARGGHRVLLLDAQRFPRWQIGESLLPATFNGIFPLLGITPDRARLGEPVLKRGATFHWGRDDTLWTMNFGGAPDEVDPDPAWPTAFNVRRDAFDQVLLDAARDAGVDVVLGARAHAFHRADDRVTTASVHCADGGFTARARWFAGATGQGCPLAPLVGRRQPSAFFRNASVFGYFHGGARLPGALAGNVLLESFGDGWAWYIPLDDSLTSVGVVLHHPHTARLGGDREAAYRESLARCRYISEYLCHAERAQEPPYTGLRVRSEFSYAHDRLWRPGALLVGDSACFVDVVLSSGVHLATFGALHAARALNAVLAGELPERLALNEFELRYRLEFATFYQGLLGLHDMRHDGATYRAWLRDMLRRTQGVFLDDTPAPPATRRRTWQALAWLRKKNAAMLAATAPPALDAQAALPALAGELVVTADGLRYARAEEAVPTVATRAPRIDSPLYDYGKLHASAAPYLQACPDGVAGALALVAAARERGIALRVRGSGHTFSGASLPRAGEVLVRTNGLDHYHFDAPDRLVAGAGAMVWDIRDLARDHGYDLPVWNGGWAGPTLGGYICAGGFGKSGLSEDAGGLWENVHAVTLVDGHGALRRIARDDPLFPWLFGCSGQLGLLVEAELRLVPHAAAQRPRHYPLGARGRIPRRQEDDPRINDAAPAPDDDKRLFWFTLLVSPEEETSAWDGLLELVRSHRDVLVPDGGWAGPQLDGVPIGYRYVIRYKAFNPPLVYPRAETFLCIGVMSLLASGDPASDATIRDIERDFVALARDSRLRLYLQAENITGQVDQRAYYGRATWEAFLRHKRAVDPLALFNRDVVFPADAL
ncbi:MAG: tryptophan 7-halogenase [Gammaproteobacteria bacterium]